nr:GyrI-like domain-containing protein [uncultured Gellertiella sp.]
MLEPPRILEADEQLTAVVRFEIPRAAIGEAMGSGRMELMEVLAAQGIQPDGPWFSRHFRMDPAIFDFEVGLPVASVIAPSGRVSPGTLPKGRIACTVYHGPYEGLGTAWSDFVLWMEENGHQPGAELWEHYATGEDGMPATVLCRPIA